MCFSAPVSLVAGGTLTVMGGVTVKKVKEKRELPFAFIPFIFGLHQLIEGLVWLSFDSPVVHTVATYAYVFIAHAFWPAWVPFAVLMLERDKGRRKILMGFLA